MYCTCIFKGIVGSKTTWYDFQWLMLGELPSVSVWTLLWGESSCIIIHSISEYGWAFSMLLVGDDIGVYSWHIIVGRVFWRIGRVIRSPQKISVVWHGFALTSIWFVAHRVVHRVVISLTNSCCMLSMVLYRKPHPVVSIE